jgi:DNA-binding CsgD family transcriptional regulator
MKTNWTLLILILLSFFSQLGTSQTRVEGYLFVDTTIWRPVVYLSIIDNFDRMNSMAKEMIIDQTSIDKSGYFRFITRYLPEDDHLFRIHISRKSDPPASLIIGGKEENHIFFIANRKSNICLNDTRSTDFINRIVVSGYSPNNSFREINEVYSYVDSTSLNDSPIKIDLIRNAVNEKLRLIADTCSNSLVSIYALYKSQFEKNYPINQQFYNKFLKKWKNEKSPYLVEFRKKIPISKNYGLLIKFLIGGISLIIGFLTCLAYYKFLKKDQNPLRNLSIQERKIFALLLEGKSNKEISEILLIGLNTVKTHVNNIYSKLDINSRKDILNLNLNNKNNGN